jgi:hypothetical protein
MIDNQPIAFHRRQPSFLADPQSISNRRTHLAVLSPVSSLTTPLSAKAPTNLSICWAGAKIEIQVVSYLWKITVRSPPSLSAPCISNFRHCYHRNLIQYRIFLDIESVTKHNGISAWHEQG